MDYPFPARRKRIAALTVSESVCGEKAVEGIDTSDCHGCWWKKVVKDLFASLSSDCHKSVVCFVHSAGRINVSQ